MCFDMGSNNSFGLIWGQPGQVSVHQRSPKMTIYIVKYDVCLKFLETSNCTFGGHPTISSYPKMGFIDRVQVLKYIIGFIK